jgi:hypothetical protein
MRDAEILVAAYWRVLAIAVRGLLAGEAPASAASLC